MRVGYRCYWERGLQLLVGNFEGTQGNYNKNVYCVYQFAFIWCFIFHHCSFNSFATAIFARNLVIHWFKRGCNKVANNNFCFSCEILWTFFIHESYLERIKFISRTVTQRRLKQVCALEPLPNRKCEFVYRKLLSFRIAGPIRKVQTHWLVD